MIGNEQLKEELLAQGLQKDVEILWLTAPGPVSDAAACIDLLFDNSSSRLDLLQELNRDLVLISSPVFAGQKLPENFIAFNGWKSFLQKTIIEASSENAEWKEKAEKVFACCNKRIAWVPANPGFIAARVVSMIINEAYLALEEEVSSKEEIDTAMKLGTSYPFGPFEWGRLIGLNNVRELLVRLAESNARYHPSRLLQQEAARS